MDSEAKENLPPAPDQFCPKLISPSVTLFACRDLVSYKRAIFTFLSMAECVNNSNLPLRKTYQISIFFYTFIANDPRVVSNRYSYSENTFWGNNKSLGEIIIINN